MRFEEWEPVYNVILDNFGFDRRADERARDFLVDRFDPSTSDGTVPADPDTIDLAGTVVAIAGGAPGLLNDVDLVRRSDVVVAASDAGVRLDDAGIQPDLIVTDLDGDPDGTVALAERGVPVVVHAHGDNRPLIETHVGRFPDGSVFPTTQAEPVGPVANYGGFTDGDRAAFLADYFGADRLLFPGWAFDDPDVDSMKRRKLRWAARLLQWLEARRGERFDVLDGHRVDDKLLEFRTK